MVGFIYIIRNTVNSKVYIGQTRVSVDTRWKEHLRHAQYGEQIINRAMRKYGVDKFYVETLEICSIEDIDDREIYYIELFDSTDKSKGYNVSIGGNTPRFKRPNLSISDLVDLYCNKMFTIDSISKKFGVSRYIIITELKNAGISVGHRECIHSRSKRIPREELQRVYNETGSIRQTAKILGEKYCTVRNAMIAHHIEYNSSKSIRQ